MINQLYTYVTLSASWALGAKPIETWAGLFWSNGYFHTLAPELAQSLVQDIIPLPIRENLKVTHIAGIPLSPSTGERSL
jgi:hypothetical protein